MRENRKCLDAMIAKLVENKIRQRNKARLDLDQTKLMLCSPCFTKFIEKIFVEPGFKRKQ